MTKERIDSLVFGFAAGLAAALFWGIYSAVGLLLLVVEVYISGFYGYTDLCSYEWKPEITEFLARLMLVACGAGLAGWLTASLYNLLDGIFEPKFR